MDALVILRRIITFVIDIILLLLVGLFFIRLFQANHAAPFVQWLSGVASPFMAPFEGIFPMVRFGAFTVDLSVFFAILVYAILGYLFGRLIGYLALPADRRYVRRTDIDEDDR